MKVLLVEDEPSMLFTLTNLLKHRGHEVIAALSAEKGLDALGDQQVDLVISDLRLPGMDGMGLIARIRERSEDVVPIIISAYGTLENAIDALKLNVCDFLRKPFDLTTFEDTLARAEERRAKLVARKKYVHQLEENLIGEERKRTILSRFVSRHVVDQILSGDETPARAKQAEKVSVLFADISDFTGLSEKLDQKSLVFMVNTFYSFVEPVVHWCGGILDKFMGDGIMAVFTETSAGADSARHALAAAIQIQWQLDAIHRELRRFELPEISIHIGVSTGRAAACSIGTQEYANYTYIGDAVNVAKRLQEEAGPGEIIVSRPHKRDIDKGGKVIPGLIRLKPLSPRALKGRQKPLSLYRVLYEPKLEQAAAARWSNV
jgi:class 3 adenylate cyclase